MVLWWLFQWEQRRCRGRRTEAAASSPRPLPLGSLCLPTEEGQGTRKSSQMGYTVEDLRNQLLCYWAAGGRRGTGLGQPFRLQVQEGSEVTPGLANC